MAQNDLIQNIYSLSPMQEGMLFHKLLEMDTNVYFEQSSFTVRTSVDLELLEKSLNNLIERYDVLRTIFIYENQKRPLQVVLKKARLKICFEDIVSLQNYEKISFIKKFKQHDIERGFNLSKEIPIRASVIKVDEEEYIFILSFHHIILDGWSSQIVFNEIFQTYNSLNNGTHLKLPKVNGYCNYIKWLEKKDKKEALSYWANYLEDYEKQARVCETAKNDSENGYMDSDVTFRIDKQLIDMIKDLARKNKVTVNSIFQSVWGIILQRYINSEDVVFGAVVSGRPAEIDGIENMVGLFINTVPVRVRCKEHTEFLELVKEVQEFTIESKKYEYVQLAEIQANSSLKQKLIENIMVFENYPVKNQSDISSNEIQSSIELEGVSEHTNYNFNFIVGGIDEQVVKLSYNSMVYQEQYINMVAGHIKQVLKEVVENPSIRISEIELLTDEEKKRTLLDFNNTEIEYPNEETVYELFEEQVKRIPEEIAVEYDGNALTYRELNEKSNSLANILRKNGVGSDNIVGIMAEKSLEMMIGIMAILKSGGAYVPIDPEYPQDRIEYMLEDSNASVLLTQTHLVNKVKFDGVTIDLEDRNLYKGKKDNLGRVNSAIDLAYIIYTSGSTGKPKGVMIQHRNVINLMVGVNNKIQMKEKESILALTTISFDMCIFEILLPLIIGLKIILVDSKLQKDANTLSEFIYEKNIDIVQITPSRVQLLINSDKGLLCLSKTQKLVMGAEPLPQSLFEVIKKLKLPKLYNMYGPTETTVWSTIKDLTNSCTVNIGKPIANTKVYILGKNNRPQPIGVAGELCISGDGLARGYINRPELMEGKFVDNPFEAGKMMYRTGDLARWTIDGDIECIGRIDNQVKIRGFRIEIGEIESQLIKNQEIYEVVIVDKEDNQGNKFLCAYFAANRDMSVRELREYLSNKLPDYMIPTYFVQLEKVPRTPNGKVDRNALPQLDGNINTGVEYVVPRNRTEEKLVELWKEILEVKNVGINDVFFELGGHSLKMVNLMFKIHEQFGIEMQFRELYKYNTISQIAELIANRNKKGSVIDEIVFVLNSNKDKTIFAFPPLSTYGISYKYAGDLLKEQSIYAFNYIEDEDKIEKYIKVMKEKQKNGPYVLMGYSAGGMLAFEVARALSKQGDEVSRIIMIDSYPLENYRLSEEHNQTADKLKNKHLEIAVDEGNDELSNLFESNFFNEVLKKKMEHYAEFISKVNLAGEKIKADIYLIKAEETIIKTSYEWHELTEGNYTEYFGYGNHMDMISTGYAEKNVEIIKKILGKLI